MNIELDLLSALRDLAPRNTAPNAGTFTVTADGQTFDVVYEAGSSSSLTLRASYDRVAKAAPTGERGGYRSNARVVRSPRPLRIALRRETSEDVEAKEMRIAREHQTGDPSFDRAVYVDSPTTDPNVLSAVLGDGARRAILALLALDIPAVQIDDDDGLVRIVLTGFLSTTPAKERGPRMAKAFAALLASLPPVVATGVEVPKRRSLTALQVITFILVWLVPLLVLFWLFDAFDITRPGNRADEVTFQEGKGGIACMVFVSGTVIANVLGGLARLVMRPYLLTRFSGASDGHLRLGAWLNLIYVWVGAFGFMVGSAITLWLQTRK